MGRSSSGRRNRLPLALLAAMSLVAGTAAVSGAGTGSPGVRFAAVGRWFADPGRDTVFHVNGVSRTVDARATVARLGPGTEVVEGEHSSYVIGPEDIRELDKTSLTVTGATPPPARERPVTVDTAGRPYAVYRQAGKVVRLGPDRVVIEAGGPLGTPVVTPDGTLWLHRVAAGLLCHLAPGADRVTCSASVPAGHSGSLSVLDGSAVFLDAADDTMTTLTLDGPGPVTAFGADLQPGIKVAATAVQGRIPVLAGGDLLLVDSRGIAGGVPLPPGRWAAPMAGRSSVVLLDLRRRQIHTYAPTGRPQRVTPLPAGGGNAELRQGQDGRVYVQIGQGRHVLVVDDEGGAESATPPGKGSPGSTAVSGPASPAASSTIPPAATGPPAGEPAALPPGVPQPTGRPSTIVDPQPRLSIPDRTGPSSSTPSGPPSGIPEGPPSGIPEGPPAGTPEGPSLTPGRPGMPPGLTAVARGTEMILTWDASPDNGAAITAYEVTWAGPDGVGGSTATGGGAHTVAIAGLTRLTAYRIGVSARNAGGVGVPAVVEAALPSRWITVTRGTDTTWEDKCGPPECAWPLIELFGFPPDAPIQITPVASKWGRFNGNGAELTTDKQGYVRSRTRFPFSGVGQTIWVDVGDTQSNRYLWPERGPS